MIVEAMRSFKTAFHEADSLSYGDLKSTVEHYYSSEFQPRYKKAVSVEKLIPTTTRVRYWQYQYIANNPNPTGEKAALNSASDGSAYSEIHARFHPIIRSYQETFGYYDIFLIDPETGHIVYSVFKEVDFATSLIDGPYKDTNFAKVFQAARKASSAETAVLEDFAFYTPSYGAPASFIASPIFDGNDLIGVLAFQMPVDNINNVMTGNGKWKENGLGGNRRDLPGWFRFHNAKQFSIIH